MINYKIDKTGSKIVYTVPDGARYSNEQYNIKYENRILDNSIVTKNYKKYTPLTNTALTDITVTGAEANIRDVDLDDITLNFCITDTDTLSIELPEDATDIQDTIKAKIDPRYIGNTDDFIDFVNCVLFDFAQHSNEYETLVNETEIIMDVNIAFTDTEGLTNAVVTITVKDADNNKIKDVNISGTIAGVTLEEAVTDTDGEYTTTITGAGEYTYDLTFELEGYKTTTKTGNITVEVIPEETQEPAEPNGG